MNHADARKIIDQAWTAVHGRLPTNNEAILAQAVAWLESNYGRAKGQHATWAADGKYVWGNLETIPKDGNCPDGTIPGKDAGNPRCFYYHSSDLESAKAFLKNLTKSGTYYPKPEWTESQKARARAFAERTSNVMAALASGSPEALAKAMKTPSSVAFFEAPEGQYATAVRNAVTAITGTPGGVIWKPEPQPPVPYPIHEDPHHGTSLGWTAAAIGAMGALAYWFSRRS